MELLLLTARAFLAVVLLVSGGAKLADLRAFARTIGEIEVLPVRPERVALTIALLEVAVGLSSLTGVVSQAINLAVLALMLSFTVVAGAGARRRPGLRCQCFGGLTDSRFGFRSAALSGFLALTAGFVVVASASVQPRYDVGSVSTAVTLAAGALFVLASAQAARGLDAMRMQE